MPTSTSTVANPMQDLLNDATTLPNPPVPGDLVDCVVMSVKSGRVLVEIEGVYAGIIAGRELIDSMDTAKNLQVGDQISAYLIEDENNEGLYVLSLRKAGREKAWEKLLTMHKSEEASEVRIKEANKGGLITELCGIKAFIPVSQLAPEHYPRVNGANATEILSRLNKYIGENFTVKVITADRNEDKLILSEKAAISIKRTTALKKISVGQKVKGQVSGIVNFGIFLIFEKCLEGLVHVSEIEWGRTVDPNSCARIGEEKEAIVIGIDDEKISLSIKRLKPDPWMDLAKDYKVGEIVTGKVNKVTPFGAFVTIKDGLNGLIHISEIIRKEGADKAEVALEAGEDVTAKIINIELTEHRLGLSMKALEKKDDNDEKAKKIAKKEQAVSEGGEIKAKDEKKDDEKAEKEEKPKAKKAVKKTDTKEKADKKA